jgi:hypothetical protein
MERPVYTYAHKWQCVRLKFDLMCVSSKLFRLTRPLKTEARSRVQKYNISLHNDIGLLHKTALLCSRVNSVAGLKAETGYFH